MAEVEYKRCSRCREVKPLLESFSRRTRARSGFQSSCKACDATFYAAFRANNPSRTRAYSATWRAKLDTDKVRAYHAKYHAANAGRIAANRAAWRAENAARIAAQLAAWHRANPEKVAAHHGRRRALKAGARAGDRAAYAAVAKWARTAPAVPCYWCAVKTTPGHRHLDHVIPLARGGADAAGNICVSCPTCNLSKGAKLPEVFAGQAELRFA